MSIKKAIIKMAENINIEDNRQQGKVKYPLIPTIITIFLELLSWLRKLV